MFFQIKTSTHIYFEFESNSTNATENNFQTFYQEKDKEKKFLTKKRNLFEEELEEEELKEENLEPFFTIFPMFKESDISNDDEISFDDDKILFLKKPKKEKGLFRTIFPEIYLFTKAEEDLLKTYLKGLISSIKISTENLPKFKQDHYIRVAIKRAFMNKHLLNALNKLLEKFGYNTYFEKFPRRLVINVAKDFNKNMMKKTLKEIFTTEKLYESEDRSNFEHNSKVVEKIEKEGNMDLNIILNRKMSSLFEEYLDSEEFAIDEINRLKKAKEEKDEYFIEKYIVLAKNLVEFFNN